MQLLCLDTDSIIIQSNTAANKLFATVKISLAKQPSTILPTQLHAFLADLVDDESKMNFEFQGQRLTVVAKKLSKADGREGTVLVLFPNRQRDNL